MDKNKQLIILGVLILVFIVMVVMRSGKPQKRAVVAPTAAPTKTVVPKTEGLKERKMSTYQNWRRDPFAVGSTPGLGGELVLTGIIWEEGQPYCIINDKIARVGQEVGGCEVLRIEKESVTVKVGDEIRILRIGGK